MFEIVKKRALADNIVEFVVKAPRIAKHCEPGQFVIVKEEDQTERIPLTICDFDRKAGSSTRSNGQGLPRSSSRLFGSVAIIVRLTASPRSSMGSAYSVPQIWSLARFFNRQSSSGRRFATASATSSGLACRSGWLVGATDSSFPVCTVAWRNADILRNCPRLLLRPHLHLAASRRGKD